MSALQALDSDDPDHTVQALLSALATLTEIVPGTLQWVPAHVGLAGNETADRLAKADSQLEQTDIPATYKEAKTLLRSKFHAEWTNQNGGYKAHLDPLEKLERKHQSLMLRLRTGHCSLNAHLKRIGVAETSLCPRLFVHAEHQARPQIMFSKPAHSMRKGVAKLDRATHRSGHRTVGNGGVPLPECPVFVINRLEDARLVERKRERSLLRCLVYKSLGTTLQFEETSHCLTSREEIALSRLHIGHSHVTLFVLVEGRRGTFLCLPW